MFSSLLTRIGIGLRRVGRTCRKPIFRAQLKSRTSETSCARHAIQNAADGGAAVVNRRWPSSPPQPISSTHPRGCIQDPALRIPAVANCESQSLVTPARVYAYVPVCMNAPARTCSSLLSRCHWQTTSLGDTLKAGRFCSSSVASIAVRLRFCCLHGRDNDTSIRESVFSYAPSLYKRRKRIYICSLNYIVERRNSY